MVKLKLFGFFFVILLANINCFISNRRINCFPFPAYRYRPCRKSRVRGHETRKVCLLFSQSTFLSSLLELLHVVVCICWELLIPSEVRTGFLQWATHTAQKVKFQLYLLKNPSQKQSPRGVLRNFAKFTSARVSFLIKLQASGLSQQLYQKRDCGTDVFLWILRNF